MNLDSRIRELSERHKRIDAAIDTEMKRASGDNVRVLELKRKKLRLKDEITNLRPG